MNRPTDKLLDRLSTSSVAGAVISQLAEQGEAMHAAGIYHATNFAPVSHLKTEFAAMRDAREVALAQHDWALVDKLTFDLDRIPQEIIWKDTAPNLVTTVGKNDLLDKYLAGSAYTAAWYMLLISSASYTTGPAAGDTAAAHGGWTESAAYSNASRPTAAWSTAAAGSKSLSAGLVFNINATDTIKGCGLISNATKSGTTGILLSAGLFTGGDQPVVNTNTLTVSYSLAV